MFAEPPFAGRWVRYGPEVPHLLAAVEFLGYVIIERPALRLVARSIAHPYDMLGALSQRAAGNIRLRVRLEPDNVIQGLVPQLLHSKTNRKYDMIRTGYPYSAILS